MYVRTKGNHRMGKTSKQNLPKAEFGKERPKQPQARPQGVAR